MKRKDFIRKAGALGAGITILNFPVFGKNAPSNKVVLAFAGVNSRGNYLAECFGQNPNVEIAYICDVEDAAIAKGLDKCKNFARKPTVIKDIRKLVQQKDFDALVVATPDHWHTGAAILGATHGKHVYVEKPGSHNAREAMLLAGLPARTKTLIQLGNQRRSFPSLQQAVKEVREGIIGRPYFGKAWYSNSRLPIGTGKKIAPPSTLDWELWQGPAPRADYYDNLVHYNWHWKWQYGTGESCNNGTHEIDACRWFLDANFPTQVQSMGGRLTHKDDWQAPDTQVSNFLFPDNKMISWEGRSSKTMQFEPSSRGFTIFAEGGSLVNLGGGDYTFYDPAGKKIKSVNPSEKQEGTNTVSATGNLDLFHTGNFIESVQGKAKLSSPSQEACKSILLCHLANVSQRSGKTLDVDPMTGKLKTKNEFWGRTYDPGYEKLYTANES
ncbi:MAG: Gfo/Idh/MocA family oxidoreductase [Chitinophagaceae bacterium]|nr:MAG: Gfo/Idh/MocA family oxidoreductase [Chitinophagaceae bacterium]